VELMVRLIARKPQEAPLFAGRRKTSRSLFFAFQGYFFAAPARSYTPVNIKVQHRHGGLKWSAFFALTYFQLIDLKNPLF
jgi:hypothetical protein